MPQWVARPPPVTHPTHPLVRSVWWQSNRWRLVGCDDDAGDDAQDAAAAAKKAEREAVSSKNPCAALTNCFSGILYAINGKSATAGTVSSSPATSFVAPCAIWLMRVDVVVADVGSAERNVPLVSQMRGDAATSNTAIRNPMFMAEEQVGSSPSSPHASPICSIPSCLARRRAQYGLFPYNR